MLSAAIAVSVGKAAAVCALTAPAASDPVTLKTRFAFTVKPDKRHDCANRHRDLDHRRRSPSATGVGSDVLNTCLNGAGLLSPVFAVNGTHTVSVTYDGDATYTGCTASKTIVTPYTPPA